MERIGVIFGGRSGEHEISLLSATSVITALEKSKYQVVCIGITRKGQWKLFQGEPYKIKNGQWEEESTDFNFGNLKSIIDFALPILHGPFGEDGKIQGVFEMLDIPYGGCGVLASSLAMDKALAKDVFRDKGLPCCKYIVLSEHDIMSDGDHVLEKLEQDLGFPMFVKPSNMGSSVGISKARERSQLKEALELALKYDRRIIVEEAVNCRDVETGVIGNSELEVAAVGEIVAKNDFYDYKAKYSDDVGTELVIPARLPKEICQEIKNLAKMAYKAIDCEGYARIDFFIEKGTDRLYINEINTIPGFTKYSMFPELWREVGLEFGQLIERIVELGYERYYAKNNRETVQY